MRSGGVVLSSINGFMVLPLFSPATLISAVARSGGGEEPSGANVLRLIQIRLSDAEFKKNVAKPSRQFATRGPKPQRALLRLCSSPRAVAGQLLVLWGRQPTDTGMPIR